MFEFYMFTQKLEGEGGGAPQALFWDDFIENWLQRQCYQLKFCNDCSKSIVSLENFQAFKHFDESKSQNSWQHW